MHLRLYWFLIFSVPIFFGQCGDSGIESSRNKFVLAKISGDNDYVVAGQEITTELVVHVSDHVGFAAKGQEVDFSFAQGIAILSDWATVTDSRGRVTTTVTWGEKIDEIKIDAKVRGEENKVTFSLSSQLFPADMGDEVLAFTSTGGLRGVFLINEDGSGLREISARGYEEKLISWSRGAKKFLFRRDDTGFEMLTDGSKKAKLAFNYPSKDIAISDQGEHVAVPVATDLVYMNLAGTSRITIELNSAVLNPSFSSDGEKLAFVQLMQNDTYQIFSVNIDGSDLKQLTDDHFDNTEPRWSPDGSKIAYTSKISGQELRVAIMNADGSGKSMIKPWSRENNSPAWSPDGQRLAFLSWNYGAGGREIFTMELDGSDVKQVTHNSLYESGPLFWIKKKNK